MSDTDQLKERLSRIEWNQERQEERLNQGAEAFSSIRLSIEDTRESVHSLRAELQDAVKPKPLPWKWLAAFGFTILCAFAGGVWTLARYPDRAEFEKVQESNNASHREMQETLGDLKEAQDTNLSAIAGKLDVLIAKEPKE